MLQPPPDPPAPAGGSPSPRSPVAPSQPAWQSASAATFDKLKDLKLKIPSSRFQAKDPNVKIPS